MFRVLDCAAQGVGFGVLGLIAWHEEVLGFGFWTAQRGKFLLVLVARQGKVLVARRGKVLVARRGKVLVARQGSRCAARKGSAGSGCAA